MTAAPWRAERVSQHPGQPAWAAPTDGPDRMMAEPWPADVTYDWVFGAADGEGVRVAVLDSGIDAGHPRVGAVAESVSIVTDESGTPQVRRVPAEDVAGHGTACAGVIRSLAPACTIANVQVLTGGIYGSGPALLAGLRWAIDEEYDVINLSLSTSKPGLRNELAELCDSAYFRRTVICSSAHNSPVVSFPWWFSSVISVASNNRAAVPDPARPARHNYNPTPPAEFFAPGVGVEVAWAGRTVIKATGNSFATPYVSGLCARLLSKHPGITPFQIKHLLYLTSANVGVNRG
jgi:subtilisin